MRLDDKKGFTPLVMILIIALAAVGIAGYFALKKSTPGAQPIQNQASTTVTAATTITTSTTPDTSNWQIYRNEKYGFELRYPNGWIAENDQRGGTYLYDAKDEMTSGGLTITTSTRNIVDIIAGFQEGMSVVSESTSTFNGVSWKIYAFREKDGDMQYMDAFTSQGGITIQMGGVRNSAEGLLDEILPTFKFIGSTIDTISRMDYKSGDIKKIFQQNGDYFITIHAVQFIRDSNSVVGYKITDLKNENDFRVASGTQITLLSDALAQLITTGVVKDNNPTGPWPPKTLFLDDLLSAFKTKGYSWEGSEFLKTSYDFTFASDGTVESISQIYIP